MKRALMILSPLLLSNCSLVTAPVAVAGKVATTAIGLAGKAAGAGIGAAASAASGGIF